MRINNTGYTTQSFKAKPLYPINLKFKSKKGTEELLPAYFSQLNPLDLEDKYAVSELSHLWDNNMYTDYILRDFRISRNNYENFFVTELKLPDKKLSERIVSIAETTSPINIKSEYIETYFLESDPFNRKKKKISGAGELAMYGIAKIAQLYKKARILLVSTNNGFYEKIGFEYIEPAFTTKKIYPPPEDAIYALTADKYQSFIDRIEKKYSINNQVAEQSEKIQQ